MVIFQELNRAGTTVILVTHERDIALHAQRIVLLRDGVMVEDERVEHPVDARDAVARLVAAGPQQRAA